MDFIVPQSLRTHCRERAAEIAPLLLGADVILVAEPVGGAFADGILQLLTADGVALPPVIRAETGGPLWTRYLRYQYETIDEPGNPYTDLVGRTGYMPEEMRAEFRAWLLQHSGAPEHSAVDVGLQQLLRQLAEIVQAIPERPAVLVVLAADEFTGEDSDPYLLDEIAALLAADRPMMWQHIGIMEVEWISEIEAANPQQWPKAGQLRSLVERGSYDPQSLKLDERPLFAAFLAELRGQLLDCL